MALFDRSRSKFARVDPRKIRGECLWSRAQKFLAGPRNMMRVGILALLLVGTLVLLHAPYEPMRYSRGSAVKENVFARVEFKFTDQRATQTARDAARNITPNVYERLPTQSVQLSEEFRGLLAQAVEAVTPPPPKTETPTAEPPSTSKDATKPRPAAEAAETPAPPEPPKEEPAEKAEKKDYAALWKITDPFDEFKRLAADPEKLKQVQAAFQALLTFNDSLAILPRDRWNVEDGVPKPSQIFVAAIKDDIYEYSLVSKGLPLFNADSRSDRAAYRTKLAEQAKPLLGAVGLGLAVQTAMADHFADTYAANLSFSNKLTELKKQEAAETVPPKVDDYNPGNLVVSARTVVDDTAFDKLIAEHNAYLSSVTLWGRLGAILGSLILVGLLLVILTACTLLYQVNVVDRVIRAFLLVMLFLLVMIVAKFFSTQLQRSMLIFPLTTAAMIVAVAYNRRFALVLSWVMILLVTLVARLDTQDGYTVVMLLVIGSSVAVLQLGEIRSRSKLIRVGFITGLVYFATVWGEELMWLRADNHTIERSALALLAGLLPGFIILGVLPFLERMFGVVTSISLLELCDVNQPALRKLAIEAPGTYSHSLLLGSLVEPACEAIGANGLLARVGAYFHDIGKVNKPQYFTENVDPAAGPSDHARLKPTMSKLIITSHIKDGLEMARQYGLPRIVNPFIAEHHGTTVIEYFYGEARRAAGDDQQPIDDTEYRYPGPKPQSKETAVLMLSDSAEGAVRSIKEPSAPKIEDKVHEIVMKRLLDGQLNESGLTLEEVQRVEQSLGKSLISVHHGRIAYPGDNEPDGGRAEPRWPNDRLPARSPAAPAEE